MPSRSQPRISPVLVACLQLLSACATNPGGPADAGLGDAEAFSAAELIEVSGRVLYRDGTPQANARLEIWQANDVGRYAHPGGTRADAPLDPNFQGYADVRADANGGFRILTIKPGLYPVDGVFERSPHIHFDIRGRQRRLVTQMYFDDTDATVLAQDKLLQHDMWGRTNPLPSTIFAKLRNERSTLDASARHYKFDVVL